MIKSLNWKTSCQYKSEILSEMSYIGEEFIIPTERLTTEDSQNFDIGLMKLDRTVIFDREISPICLGEPYEDPSEETASKKPAVFISGFGLTLYKKNRTLKNPECSTNHHLPRPYHACKTKCYKTKAVPQIGEEVPHLCDWIIYHHQDIIQSSAGGRQHHLRHHHTFSFRSAPSLAAEILR